MKEGSLVRPLPVTNRYEAFRVEWGGCLIVAYTSGKVVANEENAKPLLARILKELGTEALGYDVIVGSDEAGKGEWLGPLTVAAVALSPEGASALRVEGVMDSKELRPERIGELARKVEEASLGFHVVTIPPRRFNRLLEELREEDKGLNDLLAWGHAKAIEAVYRRVIERNRDASAIVLIDEFDRLKTEERLRRVLELRALRIVQRPDAEEEMAVAAAGILAKFAREAWIERESVRLSFDLRRLSPMEALRMRDAEAYVKRSYLRKMLRR